MALSMFVAAFMLLAAEPCMASLQAQQAMDSHAAHGDCPHCPPAVTVSSCMDGLAFDCKPLDTAVGTKQADHADAFVALLDTPTSCAATRPAAARASPWLHVDHTGPPFTVRYCRFHE